MSLAQLYTSAAPNTYVGTVRDRQSATAPAGASLVNYLDGDARTRDVTPDVFQREFTRNAAGAFKSGGAQGVTRNPGASLTRWTQKAYKLAFGGEGPSTLSKGFYNNRFTNEGKLHLYTPVDGFVNKNASAATRKNSSPSGAPTGF